MYVINLLGGPMRIVITQLDSRKEHILFNLHEPNRVVIRDMDWWPFMRSYERGSIKPYDALNISKSLPPHTFT